MRYDSLTEWCSPTVGWVGLARLRATGCLLGEGHVPVAHSDRRSWMGSPFAGGGRFCRPLAKAVPVPAAHSRDAAAALARFRMCDDG